MDRREKILIIGTLIVVAIIIPVAGTPLNSPAPYEVVNEVGEPLSIDEVWNEPGVFEVKINEVKEIPIDSLARHGSVYDTDYTLATEEIERYKERGITRAVEVIFEFKNIGYGSYIEGKMKCYGLFFDVYGIGYDMEGDYVKHSPWALDSLSASGDFSFGRNETITTGKTSENNRLILLIEENTSRIKLEFMTVKGSWDYRYEKSFYFDLS